MIHMKKLIIIETGMKIMMIKKKKQSIKTITRILNQEMDGYLQN